MIKEKFVSVVIPAYNEEDQILMVLSSMPKFVDIIFVVDDCSNDKTYTVVKDFIDSDTNSIHADLKPFKWENSNNPFDKVTNAYYEMLKSQENKYVPSSMYKKLDSRVVLLKHGINSGVGAAISTGYKHSRDYGVHCTAVMAGDGQMDPSELFDLCIPIVEGYADYSKGNRLRHRAAKLFIPKTRYIGNSILSVLTKLASGYWRISDTQTGYTAISLKALESIDIWDIYKSYGMPNDILVKLNIESAKIIEIPIKPVYNVGEKSKMKILNVIPTVSWLLFKSFFRRIWRKYFIRDFHPISLLYLIGLVLLITTIPVAIDILRTILDGNNVSELRFLALILCLFSGSQTFLFAMWMDIQDNDKLYI